MQTFTCRLVSDLSLSKSAGRGRYCRSLDSRRGPPYLSVPRTRVALRRPRWGRSVDRHGSPHLPTAMRICLAGCQSASNRGRIPPNVNGVTSPVMGGWTPTRHKSSCLDNSQCGESDGLPVVAFVLPSVAREKRGEARTPWRGGAETRGKAREKVT